jgi:hypothetical protein
MRCRDVTRELAAPTGNFDSAELNRHLASCSKCAEWARDARRFDRIWELTRADGSTGGFDRVWARVCHQLDSRGSLASTSPRSLRAWMRTGVVAGAVASAAAVFVAMLTLFYRGPQVDVAQRENDRSTGRVVTIAPPKERSTDTLANAPKRIEVEAGQLLFVRMEDRNIKYYLAENTSNTSSIDFDLLNQFEGMVQ